MEFELNKAVQILSRTPDVLARLLHDLSPDWTHENEGGDTFSPYEVIGHLIHAEEEDWIPRARCIMEEGESRSFDPFDRFAHRRKFDGLPLRELLEIFRLCRRHNLEELAEMRLTPEDLLRCGRHPELGSVTLAQLIATWTVHDMGHTAQIARVMAKQYGDAVGPWRGDHLRILLT